MPDNMLETNAFPEVFCLEDIRCVRGESGGYDCRATLYHDSASLTVSFTAAARDPRIRRGSFVTVSWLPTASSDHGALKVDGLVVRDCVDSGFNPFQSVPHAWCADRHQIECARDLWDASSARLRKLLLATFWRGLHARHARYQ